tara:strand:- start:12 stop:137 length:126 start_codon:yes stop_codon:yes gene_type:complete
MKSFYKKDFRKNIRSEALKKNLKKRKKNINKYKKNNVSFIG